MSSEPDVAKALTILREIDDILTPYTKGYVPVGNTETQNDAYLYVVNVIHRMNVNARIALGWK